MYHTTLDARVAAVTLGLLIGGAATAVNVRAADVSAPHVLLAELSPTARMLLAGDFWDKAGATTIHDFDAATMQELQKLASDADQPVAALRATKLLCDKAGHSHMDGDLSEADNGRVLKLAFEYLETHLADQKIAGYAPARGFTHLCVSETDKHEIWVLIETAAPPQQFVGGLNTRVDLKASKVTEVNRWGDVRPAKKP